MSGETSEARRIRRRDSRREKRRAELLDHAMTIIRRDGLDGLAMLRLAAEADAAVGALYRYFPGKQAVIAGLQIRSLSAFGQFQEVCIGAAEERLSVEQSDDVRVLGRIRAAFDAWPRFGEADPECFGLVNAVLSDPQMVLTDAEAMRVEDALEPILARVTALFEAAVSAGVLQLGSSRLRTMSLWAAVHGLAQLRKRDRLLPPELRAARQVSAVLTAVLVGWGASREAAERAAVVVDTL